MTQAVLQPQTSGSGRAAALGFAAGFVTGAVAVALIGGIFSSGDEAPIRVRGGSMYFEIPSGQDAKWVKDNDQWKLDRGTRKKEDLDFAIEPEFASSCSSNSGRTKKVFVEYDNGFTVEIHAAGKHLRLRPDDVDKLTPANGDKELTYGTSGVGFIKNIYLENKSGTPVCTFSPDKRIRHMNVDDY